MRKFDYSFLKENTPTNILSISNIIVDLNKKEEFRKLQYKDTFEKLRKKALIESVKGSNAIEGIVTTDDRIRDIVEGALPVTHDELEISGYKDALSLIHKEYRNLDMEEETILLFHKMIEGGTDPKEAGKIRFKPVCAAETKKPWSS